MTETCPTGWSLFNKHCYKISNYTTGKNWSEARKTCLNSNGDLVSIQSKDEDMFLYDYLKEKWMNDLVWIGRKEGAEVWSDGSNVTYVAEVSLGFDSLLNCYATNARMKWFLVDCSKNITHAFCKRRGLCN